MTKKKIIRIGLAVLAAALLAGGAAMLTKDDMNNGSMFAGVCNFKNYGYFQAHKYGWLVTPDDVYRIDFFSAAVTDCDDEIYSGFENTADRLSHIYDISAIYEPTEISEQDRLVLLSTCSYEFENARTVLTGKLVRMEDNV